ncbi:WD domain, G-beta repeat-containing protein [Toxoplasma gondii MAS]|uniref:WD domain, G-beta repeat-containing protein n=1 Tax=Toxoplasma gondii MAS TaxID=943118 RepID=A0A086QPK6_TOXGO|nr:WD domain, G-beta repeat-containing protein [Toxoplasma gondii MAS]
MWRWSETPGGTCADAVGDSEDPASSSEKSTKAQVASSPPAARGDHDVFSYLSQLLTTESAEGDVASEKRLKRMPSWLKERSARHEEMTALLIDAFSAIDIGGAGVISWEAFANALVDQGADHSGSSSNASDAAQVTPPVCLSTFFADVQC